MLAGLRLLERELRRNGHPIPAPVRAAVAALSRQDPPERADPPRPVDPAHMPALATIAEAAATLNVSRRTVERMTADGRLPTIRIGRLVRIPRDALPGRED